MILLYEIDITLRTAMAQKEPDKINVLICTIKIFGIKMSLSAVTLSIHTMVQC